MENYVFNFPPVSFDSSSDFTCPTTPAFTSYDYRNPSHASFPPDAVQTPPQPLLPPSSSDGYPALDLALLAISILQIELSLTSKTSPPTEAPTSNVPSVSSMAVLSTCPNTGVPVGCNDKVSAAKPTANKSTWAAQNPGWPVTNAVSPASLHSQRKDRDVLLNEVIQSLADEFEAKVQVLAMTHNVTHEKLANAIIHDKAHEVNEGSARGEKLSLEQIRDLARVDPKYQDMTQEEKDELLRAL
ncbi:hypothetical protein EDD15DRAFT_2366167 [Pisolithus albus]|nr:hypothetical protein EDD15DRAFT_2366167 [Pisolithus albus]